LRLLKPPHISLILYKDTTLMPVSGQFDMKHGWVTVQVMRQREESLIQRLKAWIGLK
jgi:hypothetical protein